MKKNFDRDFRDIGYFIDHVHDDDARVDVLEKMGYKIGVDVVTKETDKLGRVIVGKKKEFRIQISQSKKGLPLVKCIILE
jgi:hypothetical protein